MVSVIEGYVNTKFRSGEEKPFLLRVFAHRTQECGSSNAVGDQLPRCAIITRAIEVGHLIVEPAAIDCRISDGGIEMRCFNQRHLAPAAQSGRRNIFPVRSSVARQMN